LKHRGTEAQRNRNVEEEGDGCIGIGIGMGDIGAQGYGIIRGAGIQKFGSSSVALCLCVSLVFGSVSVSFQPRTLPFILFPLRNLRYRQRA
jgi:hypothetical protein